MSGKSYHRATSLADALAVLGQPGTRLIAGGMDLVPLTHDHVERPDQLVDIARVPGLSDLRYDATDGLWLGATASLAAVANFAAVGERYPVLRQAILASASPQIRNLATIGGNLLQKPRCWYYRDPVFACLRRDHGPECAAKTGASDIHAVFETTAPCVAVHPADPAVALAAMGATVVLRSPRGERRAVLSEFFVSPLEDATRETRLERDEIIVALVAPPPPLGAGGAYEKIRDRAAFAFALVSAAAVVALEGATVTHARLALGGVAWGPRRLPEAEAALVGGPLSPERLAEVARLAVSGAAPLPDTAYKLPLIQATVRRAILVAAARPSA